MLGKDCSVAQTSAIQPSLVPHLVPHLVLNFIPNHLLVPHPYFTPPPLQYYTENYCDVSAEENLQHFMCALDLANLRSQVTGCPSFSRQQQTSSFHFTG